MARADERREHKIIEDARKRFKKVAAREATARKNYVLDLKFVNGDCRNNYQWDDPQLRAREADKKPSFTINKTRQHCLQIINDARQNKMSIVVKPTGGGASYESAQIYSGLMRHIEYRSNAQNVYTTATRTQVQAGIGYWRVTTDYAGDDTFDQEIFIRRIKDPLSVYLDDSGQEADRSDAKFGFIFDSMSREEAEKQWPELKDEFTREVIGNSDGWLDEDKVRVAEYFDRTTTMDELVAVTIGDQSVVRSLSDLVKDPVFADMKASRSDVRKALETMGARFRPQQRHSIMWYKIAGNKIVDSRQWLGQYIPIVMLIGEETVIDGKLDRKGHTRALIDPQRNYNYWSSEAAAQVALQTKSPYVAPAEAIEGYETYWENANTQNYSVLPYNAFSDDGTQTIPRPVREQPPVMAQAYIQGMQVAAEEMRMVSGQYQAVMGAQGNETSGVAIQQRQRQGDNSTYHYIDHLSNAIRYTGRIILDLIPKVYDTERVEKIVGDDGKISMVKVDPQAAQALLQEENERDNEIKAIFNPNVGRYEVEADVGPAFATQRQEAFNAISQILQQNKELTASVGDLLFQVADFPMADEIAQRLRRMVPAQALGEGPTPGMQKLQQQNQMLNQMVQELTAKIKSKDADEETKAGKNAIDAYRAETDRIDVLKDAIFADPRMASLLAQLTVQDAITEGPPEGMDLNAPQAQGAPMPPSAPQQQGMMPEGMGQ